MSDLDRNMPVLVDVEMLKSLPKIDYTDVVDAITAMTFDDYRELGICKELNKDEVMKICLLATKKRTDGRI